MCHKVLLSHVRFFVTPWTVAHQASSAHGDFPGKNTGVGWLPVPSPGDLSNPRIESRSLDIADSLPSEPPGKPHKVSGLYQIQGIKSRTKHIKSTYISHAMTKKFPIEKNRAQAEIFVYTFLAKERSTASKLRTPWLKSCHRTGFKGVCLCTIHNL